MGAGSVSGRSLGETYGLASRGDGEAQLEMAEHTIGLLNAGSIPWGLGIGEALLWARQSEVNNPTPRVGAIITGLLLVYAGFARQEGLLDLASAEFAEAIARLDVLADSGEEQASACLAAVLDEATPAILEWAKLMRKTFHTKGADE